MSAIQKLSRLNEYRIGPEPNGIRVCMKYDEEIEPRQVWIKVWAPGGEYAIGEHVSCRDFQAQSRGPGAANVSECTLCGHMSRDAAEMATHLRLIHRVAVGVSLEKLAA